MAPLSIPPSADSGAVRRWRHLRRWHDRTEPWFILLAAAWIGLVIIDLAGGGLPPALDLATWLIWGLFIVDFAVELLVAPNRLRYLRTNSLTALSLVLPALRVLRVVRAFRVLRGARAVRSVGLLRVVTSAGRGLRALGRTAGRRGLGYVVSATGLVVLLGAAGMAAFESPAAAVAGDATAGADAGLRDYGEALWWTASTMTTGAPEQPRTFEGRLLGWGLSVYGLVILGYLTAILASHFVGQDRGELPEPDSQQPATEA
jgi:voltage-gated potassium channel